LDAATFASRLADGGVGLRVGPFAFRVGAACADVATPLQTLYADYPLLPDASVFHAHVRVRDVRRWLPRPRRVVRFDVDGRAPHEDMPVGQGLPVLEWGLNLVVALRYHCFLMFHAGALERGGAGLLLPAQPGRGKTTLCAALAHRGFRLLSDEFGLVNPGSTGLLPVPRPMPLKNESITVIRDFVPEVVLGPLIHGTRKGTLAHVRVPRDSVARMHEAAPVRFIVFPHWEAGAPLSLEPVSRADAFRALATNAFNYEMLGESAFETVGRLVEASACFELRYSDLDAAVRALAELLYVEGRP
jgi:HprK-related kinase A